MPERPILTSTSDVAEQRGPPFDFANFSDLAKEHLPNLELLNIQFMAVKNFSISSSTIKTVRLVAPKVLTCFYYTAKAWFSGIEKPGGSVIIFKGNTSILDHELLSLLSNFFLTTREPPGPSIHISIVSVSKFQLGNY